ncbi:nitrile hydratase accessory protein [Rhodobacterales bacterium 52_120_T64]|nr:nitrile hydratase accessory protein [Rhodobacterales bacterium 52_120_T64]
MLSKTENNLARKLPEIPIDDDGPVFAEPWQAQAFAMTLKLHEKGAFTWPEWADALGGELKAAGEHDSVDNYYLHWLRALEKLLDQKNIVQNDEREDCKAAWDKAARATPHGNTIVLGT